MGSIETFDDGRFCYKDESKIFYVNVYPGIGMVFIRSDSYEQVFATNKAESVEEVISALKASGLEKAAVSNKEGIVNKEKFMESVKKLHKIPKYKLNKEDLERLESFIKKRLTLAPDTVRMQLILEGYESISSVVEFEDPHPEYVESYNDMKKFLSAITL